MLIHLNNYIKFLTKSGRMGGYLEKKIFEYGSQFSFSPWSIRNLDFSPWILRKLHFKGMRLARSEGKRMGEFKGEKKVWWEKKQLFQRNSPCSKGDVPKTISASFHERIWSQIRSKCQMSARKILPFNRSWVNLGEVQTERKQEVMSLNAGGHTFKLLSCWEIREHNGLSMGHTRKPARLRATGRLLSFSCEPQNVDQKQMCFQIFLQQRWVSLGLAENCNLGSAILASHLQVPSTRE